LDALCFRPRTIALEDLIDRDPCVGNKRRDLLKEPSENVLHSELRFALDLVDTLPITANDTILIIGKVRLIQIPEEHLEEAKALAALADFDLKEKVSLYHLGCVKPLDEALLHAICKQHRVLITLEDATVEGGLGSAVAEFVTTHDYKLQTHRLGIPDVFIEHGTIAQLQELCGITPMAIQQFLGTLLER
jgi:deoxyxylulose-5-phosphate synthase